MPKILHLFKTALPIQKGGIPSVIDLLAQHAPPGFQHRVLAMHTGKNPLTVEQPHCLTEFVPARLELLSLPLSLNYLSAYRRAAASADLIHYHFPFPMADVAELTNPGKPSLVTYHSDIVRQQSVLWLYRPLMNLFLKRTQRIVATSTPYLNSSPVLQRYAHKTSVIPLGVPDAVQPSAERLSYWQQRLGRDFFLFVGALRNYKGLEVLQAACRQNGLPTVIAGPGTPPEHSTANPNPLIYLGEVSDEDRAALYTLCRALVLPSNRRSEAFGVVLAEAASYKKPLISTELGTGTSFVNLNGVTGLVVPPNDSQALAAAMTHLANNDSLCQEYGAAALARFKQYFTVQGMAAAYHSLYQEILDS